MAHLAIHLFFLLLPGFMAAVDPSLEPTNDNRAAKRWAVLIAGSNGYRNYRHQADVCHAYQVLKKGGLKDKNIIVFMYDDILLIYAVFLAYCIFQQLRRPWELRYHAYFMDDLDSWIVISADCAAVLACLLAVMGLLRDPVSHPQWLLYSCYMGACLALFWLYYMMRLPRFRWDIIWLPLGPFSSALLCLYVNHLLAESLEDIRKLRGSMYYHKTR